jgi:predicted Zn finger-like uncharacterized protein
MAKSILVVDDDRLIRETVRDTLVARGFVVTTASSTREAIELVRKFPSDICLVDIIMPGDSGYVACQEIKKIAEKTRVVMMSGGFLGKADIQLCHQLGADGFLPKPFKLSELLSLIESERPPAKLAAETAPKAAVKNPEGQQQSAAEAKTAAAQPPPETKLVTCPDCKAVSRVRQERLVAAKFKFRCPKCDYVFLLKEEQALAAGPAAFDKVTGRRSKKILVVDDTEFFRRYISDLLTDQGYLVVEAKTGPQALMEVESEKPDLVLSDVLLPGMHGFELCKKIKALPLPYSIKVIFMTGVYKSLSYQLEAQKTYGADGYLLKPVQDEDLLKKIQDLLGPPASA